MNDHAGVIDDDPQAFFVSRGMQGSDAFLPATPDDGVTDRANLPIGITLADHEKIGNGGLLANIEPDDVPRLLLRSRTCNELAELKGRHW